MKNQIINLSSIIVPKIVSLALSLYNQAFSFSFK